MSPSPSTSSPPRSPPYQVADPTIKACDYALPNFNNSLVEYEVVLKDLLERDSVIRPQYPLPQDPLAVPASVSAGGDPGSSSRAVSVGPATDHRYRLSPPFAASSRAASIGPSTIARVQGSLRVRQDNDAAAASWDASIEQMLNAAALGNYEGSTFSGDAHVSDLLRMYLNGELLHNMTRLDGQELYNNMMALRRDHVFPMITASKAAYGALIAYMETTPGIPIKSENEFFVRWHLNMALSLMNSELADPQKLDSDGVILTIVLLMMIAQRSDDMATFKAHASGIHTLTSRRQLALQEARSQTSGSPVPTEQSPYFSETFSDHLSSPTTPATSINLISPLSISGSSIPFASTPTTTRAPTSAPTSKPHASPSNSRGPEPTGSELQNLVDKGLITPAFAKSHQYTLILNGIGLEARYDWVLALALAQHLWTDGGAPTGLSALESAIANAARLCLHLNVWPVTSRPCPIALRSVAAIRASLLNYSGLDSLYFSAPDALVWFALTAGPLSLGHARGWFALVLRRAAPLAAVPSFAAVVAVARSRFAWSGAMALAAHVFWVATLHPAAFSDDALPDYTRRCAGQVDADERAQAWMLAQRLCREARIPRALYGDAPWERGAVLEDARDAEAALVDAVFIAAYWEIDEPGLGRRRPIVWIPPSPPCLLGSRCGAHGGPAALGTHEATPAG